MAVPVLMYFVEEPELLPEPEEGRAVRVGATVGAGVALRSTPRSSVQGVEEGMGPAVTPSKLMLPVVTEAPSSMVKTSA